MKVLLVAATAFEIAPLLKSLKEHERQPYHYQLDGVSLEVLLTGVGLPLTAFALGHRFVDDEWTHREAIAHDFYRDA